MVELQAIQGVVPEHRDDDEAEVAEGPKAPTWKRQPKKGHKKRRVERAKKAHKAEKREQLYQQRQQERLQERREQEQAQDADDAAPVAAEPTPSPRSRQDPLGSMLPSLVRRELLRQQAKRRPGMPRAAERRPAVAAAAAAARNLQCPVTWGLRPLATTPGALYTILDSTPFRGTAWHGLVEQIQVACDFARLPGTAMQWKCRELLEDVYAMLHAGRAEARTALVREYRAGLKHVLDATWLLVRDDADVRAARPLPDGTRPEDVMLFEELSDKQRACVYAIKAVMAQDDVAAADKALELDPAEGQWHYVKWLCLRAGRAARSRLEPCELEATSQEAAVLRKAYSIRKTPPIVLAMAQGYADGAAKDAKLCAQYMCEAAELFPLSAYVHFHSGHLYQRLCRGRQGKGQSKQQSKGQAKRDSWKIVVSFKMAIHLAQGSWLKASTDWGLYCMENGMEAEGLYHLIKAGAFD